MASLRLQQNASVLRGDLVCHESCKTSAWPTQVRRLEEGEETCTPLSEVLVPVLGFAVEMPDNESRHLHDHVLQDMGLDIRVFAEPESQDGFSMPGGYRRLVCKPSHFKSKTLAYPRGPGSKARLVPTDLDHILEPLCPEMRPLPTSTAPLDLQTERLALVLEFRLPRASYATMAIRELLKK